MSGLFNSAIGFTLGFVDTLHSHALAADRDKESHGMCTLTCSQRCRIVMLQDGVAAEYPTQDGRVQSELVPGKPCLVLLLDVLLIIRLC